MTTLTRSRLCCASSVGALGLLLVIAVAGATSDGKARAPEPSSVPELRTEGIGPDSPPGPVAVQMGQPDPTVALLDKARTYQRDGRLEDALSLCRQVLNGTPARPDALELGVEVLISLSAKAQQSQNFDRACANAIEAQDLVDRARQIFEQEVPGQQAPEAITGISQADDEVADRWAALREPLRANVWEHLVSADGMWKDASPWYWSNNLDRLSEALRQLRDVRDLLPFAEDKAIESKYFAIYGHIRSCVPETQWDTVQARAGMLHPK